MHRRVVVTGLGPVASLGIGKDEFFDNLMDKKQIAKHLPDSFYRETYSYKTSYYVPMPDFNIKDYQLPGMYQKTAGLSSQMAMIGSVLALEDAGFRISSDGKKLKVENLPQTAIVLGTGFCNIETAFDSYCAHNELIASEKKTRYNRLTIPVMMNNAPSSWVSVAFGIQGESYTVNGACASGTIAIGDAYRKIRYGDAELALTGGVESLKERTGALVRGFDQLGTLTTALDGNPAPFSKNRSGFLFNEGAGCMLVLESLEHALKRKADIYAEIVDYTSNSDAYNIVQMDPTGEKVISLMKELSHDRNIDYINTHGTGTQLNDEVEAEAIRQLFGKQSEQPCLGSTKSIIGHSIGASGALEAAVTAYSIKHQKIHGTITGDIVDDLNIITDTSECDIKYALTLSYGFGGHNAGLLLSRCEI